MTLPVFPNPFATAKSIAISIVIIVIAAILIWQGIASWRSQGRQAKLGNATTSAAVASGQDAVATIGGAGRRETDSDQVTRENDDAIRSSDGADAPVADGVRNAGLNGLCRRAAYHRDPKCVQRAPAH